MCLGNKHDAVVWSAVAGSSASAVYVQCFCFLSFVLAPAVLSAVLPLLGPCRRNETVWTWEITMRGLLPRSLPFPIPYNPDLSSGCSLFCGDLRRLSPGRLCCNSRRSRANAYLWAVAPINGSFYACARETYNYRKTPKLRGSGLPLEPWAAPVCGASLQPYGAPLLWLRTLPGETPSAPRGRTDSSSQWEFSRFFVLYTYRGPLFLDLPPGSTSRIGPFMSTDWPSLMKLTTFTHSTAMGVAVWLRCGCAMQINPPSDRASGGCHQLGWGRLGNLLHQRCVIGGPRLTKGINERGRAVLSSC